MEGSKIKNIFSEGPAPPGDRPPNTALFARLESHLLGMSQRVKVITARIDLLRNAHRIETCTAMRLTIKDQIVEAIKDNILLRKLMAKYSLKLKALQEAEISKVVRHLHGIDKIYQAKSNELALLKVRMKQQTDPAKIRLHRRGIYAVVKWQEKTRVQRDRWRQRLALMEAAKVKELKPPTSSRAANASKISTPKPVTETKSNNEVVLENIGKNVSTPKPMTEATHPENINKEIYTPKPNTDTKCIPHEVASKSKEKIGVRKMDNTACKRCAYLQRANKNKKNMPKVCKVCLKWAHKVLQNGVEMVPNRSTLNNNTTVSESAMMPAVEPALNADIESTIKVEIEPVTDFSIMQECVTVMDPFKPSSYVEIEPLDASMNDEIMLSSNDEIMSDVITEEETPNLAKTELVDFEEVISIQDGLKAIDDKNTALAHVRILQEYAMLNDNYRAIGLLSEVEAALISPAKNEDFQC